eukprot:CAMPEP_0115178258 /NCGR_PEP_ID=MMETSP0270-20121206/5806_1 /TAXON_ID=71861 /ORGANISM="Scrippsiella trochoidea, Strain CCMP3099" /LENGTH=47 /DNA_ID= /DNA_START= /DNA_END= /DNA_ORIENTATION=
MYGAPSKSHPNGLQGRLVHAPNVNASALRPPAQSLLSRGSLSLSESS